MPPIRYSDVYRLKQEMPELTIEINGELRSIEHMQQHLSEMDGVMLGRAVCDNPFLLKDVDHLFYGDPQREITRESIVDAMVPSVCPFPVLPKYRSPISKNTWEREDTLEMWPSNQ